MRLSTSFFALALLVSGPAVAQDRPGQVFHILPEDMPAPYATESVANSSNTVARDGRVPAGPDGFSVTLFAKDLSGPRKMLALPNGDLLVARSRAGAIALLADEDGDGRADTQGDVVSGFNRPHGLALFDGALWIADLDGLYRLEMTPGAGRPAGIEQRGADRLFGPSGGHWTRNIAFSPDGRWLYASIGSRGNIGEEPEPRATIQRYPVGEDGSIGAAETFATGLRNPVGIGFLPGTDRLFTVVNERDGMGDGLVPDYFTEVRQGAFYGWPYAYIGANPQPGLGDKRPDLVEKTVVPDTLIQSHSAPIGLTFLADADVPEDWRDDALVTLRGSWNSAQPTGYKVVRIEFENGAPTGRYINFLTGFRIDTPNPDGSGPATVWGRPVGVAVGADGAVYVGDEIGGTVWRVVRK